MNKQTNSQVKAGENSIVVATTMIMNMPIIAKAQKKIRGNKQKQQPQQQQELQLQLQLQVQKTTNISNLGHDTSDDDTNANDIAMKQKTTSQHDNRNDIVDTTINTDDVTPITPTNNTGSINSIDIAKTNHAKRVGNN